MNFNELKETVEKQYKNEEIIGDDGQPLTVKDWKQTNANIRRQLKLKKVKCKTAFYNPNDNRIYIKQTFRNVRIDELIQIANTYEDIMSAFFIIDDEKVISISPYDYIIGKRHSFGDSIINKII